MKYVYDIILNYSNKQYYDFFEWENTDNLINVKKIPVFKVNRKIINDFINYNIKIDKKLLTIIKDKSIFLKKDKYKYNYSVILSSGEKAIGICFNKNGDAIYKSSMLLDEESEVNNLVINEKEKIINYKKYGFNNKILKCDLKKRNIIKNELNKEYRNREFDKLKYIYYEVFNDNDNNINKVFNKLIKEIDNNIYLYNNVLDNINIK